MYTVYLHRLGTITNGPSFTVKIDRVENRYVRHAITFLLNKLQTKILFPYKTTRPINEHIMRVQYRA